MTRRLESDEYAYIDCQVRHVTERAVLVHDSKREAWIPRSQIEDLDPASLVVGSHVELLIPTWLAEDKGLV